MSPLIVHKDTAMCEAISPAECVVVTLGFFATGILYNDVNVVSTFQWFDCFAFSINVWFGISINLS